MLDTLGRGTGQRSGPTTRNFSLRDGHYQLAAPRRRRPWQSVPDAAS